MIATATTLARRLLEAAADAINTPGTAPGSVDQALAELGHRESPHQEGERKQHGGMAEIGRHEVVEGGVADELHAVVEGVQLGDRLQPGR